MNDQDNKQHQQTELMKNHEDNLTNQWIAALKAQQEQMLAQQQAQLDQFTQVMQATMSGEQAKLQNIMDLLKELSLRGKMVFVVIHQPSSDIFKLFDTLIIMDSGGFQIYYGNPVESVIYFRDVINAANKDQGACPECGGLGTRREPNEPLMLGDPRISILEGVVLPWGEPTGHLRKSILPTLAKQYKFDLNTMPFVLTYDDGDFSLNKGAWVERKVGTLVSNPDPTFVGNKIKDVSSFQGRLVFVAGSNVITSKTNRKIYGTKFWKMEATVSFNDCISSVS